MLVHCRLRASGIALVVALGLTAAGCGESSFPPGVPLEGAWGAEHLLLVADEGGASLEYDCATGVIEEPLVPDRAGRFDLTGTHTFERGGPIQVGEDPDIHPARYAGSVSGRTLVLTITLTDTMEVVGTYTLIRGASGSVYKCL